MSTHPPATEAWRPIAGYEDLYEVSSLGRVRSLGCWVKARAGASSWWKPGRTLKAWQHKTGHWNVLLVRGGERSTVLVHRLVLTAFAGPPSDGEECRHIDGNPSNNTAANLRWGTHTENMADMVAHGTSPRGERNSRARLTAGDVRAMRSDRTVPDAILAGRFGVHPSTINAARAGKTWQHVEGGT